MIFIFVFVYVYVIYLYHSISIYTGVIPCDLDLWQACNWDRFPQCNAGIGARTARVCSQRGAAGSFLGCHGESWEYNQHIGDRNGWNRFRPEFGLTTYNILLLITNNMISVPNIVPKSGWSSFSPPFHGRVYVSRLDKPLGLLLVVYQCNYSISPYSIMFVRIFHHINWHIPSCSLE